MNRIPLKAAAVTVTGLAIIASGVSGGVAHASAGKSVKPVTTCSDWSGVGDSTVSARTCLTLKAGKKTSAARGSVQVRNTGTANAKVTVSWTVTETADDSTEPAKVKTVKVGRSVPANGRVYLLGGKGKYSKLDATALAGVQAKIVVKAASTGTDTETDAVDQEDDSSDD